MKEGVSSERAMRVVEARSKVEEEALLLNCNLERAERKGEPTLGYPWYPEVVVAGVETGDVDGRAGRVEKVWLYLGSGGETGGAPNFPEGRALTVRG